MSLLHIRDLRVSFTQYTAGLHRHQLDVVNGLDLDCDSGELVAVVGASGSGKSILAHAVLGLLPSNAVATGTFLYDGESVTNERLSQLRGHEITLIPQSTTHLDPVSTVGSQVRRAADVMGLDRPERRVATTLERVRLEPDVAKLYPHQISGGMARRVMTAIAAVGTPRLIIADEPTPGLEHELLDEVLTDLRLRADSGTAVVLITHHLKQAAAVADRVVVFDDGRTVETAPGTAFQGEGEDLETSYARTLWRSLPEHHFTAALEKSEARNVTVKETDSGSVADDQRIDETERGLVGSGLSAGYRGRIVFEDVSVDVNPGEIVGLFGPSGCGKTTLGRVMSGHLATTSGTVTVDGKRLPRWGRSPVQLIVQNPLDGVDPRWRLERTIREGGKVDDSLLNLLAIDPTWLSRYPNEVSGGELQRIVVARALAATPRFIVADEITAMLDAVTQAQVWNALVDYAVANDVGVLAIAHDRALLDRVCDRIIDWA